MITIFDGIPDIFVDRYDAQFVDWGRQFRVRGKRCAIVFDVLPGQDIPLDSEGRVAWIGAWLKAEVESLGGVTRVVISPASDWDRHLIETHCWCLKRSRPYDIRRLICR
jgi:hypothetical protein